MKLIAYLLAVTIIILLGTTLVFAQLPPELLPKPNQAPIDGGLGILAAAGGSYALKKLRDKKKMERE